jgi:hypothetical protein
LLGDAAAAGQLCTTRRRRVAETMISGLLTSSPTGSPCLQCIAHGEWVFEGLGLQVVALMMSSNWNVEEVTAKY